MRTFPCADIRIYGSTLNYGAEIYGSTLNEIILLLLLLLLPRTPPPCRLFAARCAGERAGNGPGRKVPAQWYKKFRVREQTRRAWAGVGGKCGGNMAEFRRQSSAGAGADTEYVYICNRYITNIYIFLYITAANVSN